MSIADGYARVHKFNDMYTFSTCPAFLQCVIPTAFPFLTICPLFRAYTLVNAIQIESHLNEVNQKSHQYASIE
jgi:hypothetical protein